MDEDINIEDIMADLAELFGQDLGDIAGDADAEAYLNS